MPRFIYKGSLPGNESRLLVCGIAFPTGIIVEVSDAVARKLRCLPYFIESTVEPPALVEPLSDAAVVGAVVAHETAFGGPQTDLQPTSEPQKKRRGRPPGSKNKPKVSNGNAD